MADTTPTKPEPTFTMTDPEAAPAKPAASDGQKQILIAEDDPFISRMYQIKLESAGYKVIVKNNGRDAFEAIKSEHPNLAVLDINMPELSGLEVLGALQNDNFDFTSMPVIVLTNSSELSDRNAAHSYGAEYLVKAELTPRQVLDMIGEKLGLDKPKGDKGE
ncbi:MAG TPA: response regulator [Candidatus Saccharimonadia bacterium]|nr:response regulator [Candidatus Saccharimonadia bacterium]